MPPTKSFASSLRPPPPPLPLRRGGERERDREGAAAGGGNGSGFKGKIGLVPPPGTLDSPPEETGSNVTDFLDPREDRLRLLRSVGTFS